MKTRMNILTLACALTCFSCIGTAHTIQPSKNYQTEKRSLGDIREVSTLSSIDVVYHQTSGSPYAEIYASDNVMPYVVLKESKGELRVYYQDGTSIQGENRCRVDVYAPSVSRFTTMASGDISIPKGLKHRETYVSRRMPAVILNALRYSAIACRLKSMPVVTLMYSRSTARSYRPVSMPAEI